MVNKKDFLKEMDKCYADMISQVDIYNFTKCVAQFAGMEIKEVPDKMIKEYLLTWAESKRRFFDMLDGKIRKDLEIEYHNPREGIQEEIRELMSEYPVYAPWLSYFRKQTKNKVDEYLIEYEGREHISNIFPRFRINGTNMTHFFKQQLEAPDELVTAIGRIFESSMVSGKWTISIDPVDMMLASENPYNWDSCYRLTAHNMSSHADGCIAAILDTSSLITYIWSKEGKMDLYGQTLDKVRYKRMRAWVSISPKMTAIHFNSIYPTKNSYGEDFKKQLRSYTEAIVAEYLGIRDSWKNSPDDCNCWREYEYGYSEYDQDNIYKHSDAEGESWEVFDRPFYCPCGCGYLMPGSYEVEEGDGHMQYNGEGFRCCNFEERWYCEYSDDYCSVDPDERGACVCGDCYSWQRENPTCELDPDHYCEDPSYYLTDNGVMSCDPSHCRNCPLYSQHHPEEVEEKEERVGLNLLEAHPWIVSNGYYCTSQDITTSTDTAA